ncbi:MAG TPA: YjgN family protein [Magnetospirillaceae bacterium]|nr:YjgN family protein [Magnetospirillaceae bacterium]
MDDIMQPDRRSLFAEQPLNFTGTGGEYFRIWIVNLLLTIVTLGIYSAWAKVRRLQYFYRHTEVAGSSFDFHGNPVRILIGRIVALVMLGLYNYTIRLQSIWTVVVLVALAIIVPGLLRNSLRFRLYNTSWRGTRFHFRGSVGGAYRVFLLFPILSLVTLYGLAPFTHQRIKAYQHGNSWFGTTPFSFNAGVGRFYLAYLLVVAGIVGFFILGAFLGLGSVLAVFLPGKAGGMINPKAIFTALATLWAVGIVLGLSIGSVFHVVMTNLIWSNTKLGEHRIDSDLEILPLLWIGVSNFVLVVVTLGFFTPWAMVRLARYQIGCITILPDGAPLEFVDAGPEDIGAVGEEAASIFDIDIAL